MSEDIIRRDPRAEWIARNRLHPLHQTMQASPAETRGPSGLIRRNPHAVGFIGPNGIKRIDRMNASGPATVGGRRAAGAAKEVELPLHRVENPDYYIAVVPDMVGGRLNGHDKDVIGQAHKLIGEIGGNGAVLTIVFGEHREEAFDKAGVDRLLHLQGDEYEGYSPELRVAALAQVEKEYAPRYWLLPDSVAAGFELGCRLAARIGERPATQAWQVGAEQTICRGAGGTSDITRQTPRLLLLAEECADQIDETRHEVLPVELVGTVAGHASIRDCGQVAVDPNAIPLAEAEFILSAGNGVSDWAQFHQAAEALGATEGASRVAVDDGNMPRFRQVGATGTWVTARVYVAVGISGAIQHMQGIGQCDKVIAINTDVGCDMVKRAALSVIGDSSEVLAELIRLAKAHRQEVVENAA
ncbi:electron transfer flavoprotein subunit alpha/FixB family protein [Marinobacterium sp. D7]|uniref:electron transfer flavoprotein subunit alpha n=1 Tax=Marinobacterium ramblicola TaxID=2849041 RepID=UPI001C2DE17F|nr:electron transfer flavoprotein subunit alpha/FixB family protein [Marinobacterium ramblicola]MBV1790434.1 electron transfer flavoprotein subunit alpha/FixB family protein [Marinobacterium ramblicola]